MTTEEHLKKIKSKCHELLVIAEKRTPGEWYKSKTCVGITAVMKDRHSIALVGLRGKDGVFNLPNYNADSDYIAACAGAAEAGWRATIAAIEGLQETFDRLAIPAQSTYNIRDAIIAAWPEELL